MVNEEQVVNKLNYLYLTNKEEYKKCLETLKGVGYTVFRNTKGKHKVTYNTHYFEQVFGGAFAGRL